MSRSWYRLLFDGRLGKFWVENYLSERWKLYTEKEIAFLKESLNKGITLDLCCGPGRHSAPLSSHCKVVSLDLSRYLLSVLKDRCQDERLCENLNLTRADMRLLPFKPDSFDNVINLQTSFGYFSDEENELVLREVSRLLKHEGIFVLEMANPGWIMSNFQRRGWDETEGFYLLEERGLNWERKRMSNRWILIDKKEGGINELRVDHRLYDLNELEELLMKVGLEVVSAFGSAERERFDEISSRRILIVSKKS